MMGLLTGTVLGAGLGMLLAPKAGSELRGAIGEQAQQSRQQGVGAVSARRQRLAAGDWAEKGREFVDQARDAVVARRRGGARLRRLEQQPGTTGSTVAAPDSGSTGGSFELRSGRRLRPFVSLTLRVGPAQAARGPLSRLRGHGRLT